MPEPDRPNTDPELFSVGLEHAWNWFSLHAGQRLQCVHFFILATAAVVAGFATVLTAGKLGTAFVIGLTGAAISIVFNLLERRTKELVKAGEAALREFEQRLAEITGISTMSPVDRVELTAISRSASYSKAINMLHAVPLLAWIGGCFYVWSLMYPRC